MGKMKEITQIPIKQYPFVQLLDILDEKEYLNFIEIFGYTPYNLPFEEAMRWNVNEDNSVESIRKVNDTLLVMGFHPKDIVYLEL